MYPVVHHVELCVSDGKKVLSSLDKFGFYLYGQRTTPVCHQWVAKVGGVVFIITERQSSWTSTNSSLQNRNIGEPWTVLCCENLTQHKVDTVFNVAFRVKDVEGATKRIVLNGGCVIQPPTQVKDQFGGITYSIVRSCCGNVVHTLLNKDDYSGPFLPGYEIAEICEDFNNEINEWNQHVTHVDHVTLACFPGNSHNVISWYEKCFGMQRFSISRDDNDDEGLVLEDGVGLRLKAMEYWRCAETGLMYPQATSDSQRAPNSIMMVVVETLPGQTNCNVETFLREHEGPGVEHIAFSTPAMFDTVSKMAARGVDFRKPPAAYYNQIYKSGHLQEIGIDVAILRRLGILLDSEVEPDDSDKEKPKYLMQIFAHPLFDRKTFFVEVIQRCGARGLGAGNILALIRTVREEEAKRRAQEAASIREEQTSPRELC